MTTCLPQRGLLVPLEHVFQLLPGLNGLNLLTIVLFADSTCSPVLPKRFETLLDHKEKTILHHTLKQLFLDTLGRNVHITPRLQTNRFQLVLPASLALRDEANACLSS